MGPEPGPRIKPPRALLGQSLTERERQAARLVHQGKTVAGVAHAMGISDKTARNHLSAAYAKAGVGSRAEFVLWAERGGLQRNGIESEPTPAAELLGPPSYLGSDVRLRQDGGIPLADAQPNDLLRITWKGKRVTLWVVAVEDVPVDGVAGLRAESVLVDDLPPTPRERV